EGFVIWLVSAIEVIVNEAFWNPVLPRTPLPTAESVYTIGSVLASTWPKVQNKTTKTKLLFRNVSNLNDPIFLGNVTRIPAVSVRDVRTTFIGSKLLPWIAEVQLPI